MSPHNSRTCHGWSWCNSILVLYVFLLLFTHDCSRNQTYMYIVHLHNNINKSPCCSPPPFKFSLFIWITRFFWGGRRRITMLIYLLRRKTIFSFYFCHAWYPSQLCWRHYVHANMFILKYFGASQFLKSFFYIIFARCNLKLILYRKYIWYSIYIYIYNVYTYCIFDMCGIGKYAITNYLCIHIAELIDNYHLL